LPWPTSGLNALGLDAEGNFEKRLEAVEDELEIDVDTGILDEPAGLPTERLRRAAKVLVDDERATPWITSHSSREPSYPGVSRWPWHRKTDGELE
jgi:hypothetical protein